jgi:capsular exopolysaccharide synthesis family protein
MAECMKILFRNRLVILGITSLAGLGAAAVTYTHPRVYESRASLEVQDLSANFLNLQTTYPTAAPRTEADLYILTQAELLQQDSLLEEVAGRLGLPARPEYQPAAALLPNLREDIRIVRVKGTRILQIVCHARDAGVAAGLANTLAQTFIDLSRQDWQRGTRQTYQSLQAHIKSMEPDAFLAGGDEDVYDTILGQENDVRTAALAYRPAVRLVSPAEGAQRPKKPNVPLNLAIGLAGGLVVAIGTVMLREPAGLTLHEPRDGVTALPLPVLGYIPDAGCAGDIFQRQAHSPISEAFRGALTAMLCAGAPRTIVVTSSFGGEGKTTAACNLAIGLAEIGYKTVLIDAQSRGPRLHEIFNQSSDFGLSELLRPGIAIETLPVDAVVRRTGVPQLHLLPAGTYAMNSSRFLPSDGLLRLLRRLRDEFEFVIVDAPACLESAGARELSRCADAVVLVVRVNHTTAPAVQSAAELLQRDGARLAGLLLNRV